MLKPAAPLRGNFTPTTTAAGNGLNGPAKFVARALKGKRNQSLYWAACRAGELVAKRELSEPEAINKLFGTAMPLSASRPMKA